MPYSFIKKIIMAFCFMTITNVVYATADDDTVVTFQNIVDDTISLKEQLNFLDKVQHDQTSFDYKDFALMEQAIVLNRIDKKIKFKILEILLEDRVNNIPTSICKFIQKYMLNFSIIPVNEGFLPLKVIIKVDPQNYSYQHSIFFPFHYSGNIDKVLLNDYEKYLVKNLKYFAKSHSTGFPFYDTIEKLYFKTQDLELKSEYIDAMFYLDMWRTLLKVISDTSLDYKYRKQAILVSLKLLPHSNSFAKFSENFFYILKEISENPKEVEEIRDISDHIVNAIRSKEISLKNFNLCNLFFH